MDIIEHSLDNSSDSGKDGMKEEVLTPALSIVEEEGSLGSTEDTPTPTTLIEGDEVQYEFREDGVAYSVVQVTEEGLRTATISGTASFSPDSPHHPVQTIYSNPINGGIYVYQAHDVIPIANHKTIMPRSQEENTRTSVTRDDKRRLTHNEVERRRRDKINNWILKLSKIIPDCKQESSKGNLESNRSKGGILAKACDYITDLRERNERLTKCSSDAEQLSLQVKQLSKQVKDLKTENEMLRHMCNQHGIRIPS